MDQGYYYEVVQRLPWQDNDAIKNTYPMSSKMQQAEWLSTILTKNQNQGDQEDNDAEDEDEDAVALDGPRAPHSMIKSNSVMLGNPSGTYQDL